MSTVVSEPARTGTLSRTVLWGILGLVLLADALDMIDATVTNIAAPTIVGEIGAAYTLALGVLLVVDRLGDTFGPDQLMKRAAHGRSNCGVELPFTPAEERFREHARYPQ